MLALRAVLNVLRSGPAARLAFRRFWLGVMLSRTGDQFTVVAVSWFVLDISGPGALGLVFACFGLPALAGGPVAGRLLDRYQPRVVMAVDNAGRAVLVALVPLLHWLGVLDIWHVCLVALACGILSPVTEVGEGTLVPELVANEDLERANSLVSANWEVAALAGPVTAGVLVGWLGAPVTLLLDSATFLAMVCVALSLPRLVRGADEAGDATPARSSVEALRETFSGFTLLWRTKAVGFLVLLAVTVLLLEGVREVLFPVFARGALGSGAAGYGMLVSALGLGSLLGLAVLGALTRRFSPGVALGGILILGGAAFAPLAFAGSLTVAIAVVFVAGTALSPFYVVNRSASQRMIPDHLRGRVLGAGASLGAAGFPLGSAFGGLLLAGFSASSVILLSSLALACLGTTAFALRGLLRSPGEKRRPEGNLAVDVDGC